MYIGEVDGFNPLKAIGRALGSTGRAIVGAIVPGGQIVSKVLDTAARQPAGAKDAVAQQITAAASAVPTAPVAAPVPAAAPVSTTTPPAPSATDELTKAALLKFITSQPVAAPAPQPVIQPSGGPVVISAPAPSAPAASALPPWAIPAMIGGLALALVMSQKR